MRTNRGFKIFLIIALIYSVFVIICNIIPPHVNHPNNPFISDTTMLVAHRGGAITNPENTMKAFKSAVYEYDCDILETDIWMTKDNKLVFNHDGSLNRTTDIEDILPNYDSKHEYLIEDFTLAELRDFNYGYKFEANGLRPYKDLVNKDDTNRYEILKENDLSITELSELFLEFYPKNKELKFIIEIKNGGEKGIKAANMLDSLLTNDFPEYKDNVIVGSFHNEIEKDIRINHKGLYRGASPKVATTFILTQVLCLNIFENSDCVALQLPLKRAGISLNLNTFIRRAHRKGIAVQYWTINEKDDMELLLAKGVDAIMSDDIALLRSTINEFYS